MTVDLHSRRWAISLAALSILRLSCVADAQVAGDFGKLTVADVVAPTSPAFTILGIAPSSIQRPMDLHAVSSSLLSLAKDNSGIPKNIAVEVDPFWLTSRPTFTFEDFYGEVAGGTQALRFLKTVGRTFLRSSAISLASTPRFLDKDTLTALAVGFRAMLWPGTSSAVLNRLRARLEVQLGICAAAAADVSACYNNLQPLLDSLKANMVPVGFRLEVAGATGIQSPQDTFRLTAGRSVGVWITPSYTLPTKVDFVGVVRYLTVHSDTVGVPLTRTLDTGLQLAWRPSTPFALSVEGLLRHLAQQRHATFWTHRYGAVVEFRAAEGFYVTYAIGKDFSAAAAARNPLFSSLGLSIGFGSKPSVNVAG